MEIVVDFNFVYLSRVVSNRVKLSINDLGEYCADYKITCIGFNDYRPNRLEMP
jgi:hypothetical protein